MTVLQINAVYEKYSTGRTCKELHTYFLSNNIDSYIASPDLNGLTDHSYKIGNKIDRKTHALLSRLLGNQGYYSKHSTKKLITFINSINPDVVILRNLHGNYINIELLLNYLSEKKIAVILVLHDCWFYTGKCVYYMEDHCDRWRRKCGKCPALKKGNPSLWFDKSSEMLEDKKRLFSKIDKLAVVGVSKWVSKDASISILRNAMIHTYIYNWIDLDKFQKKDVSLLKTKIGIENKKVILGIAMIWNQAKGYQIFNQLAEQLSDEYQIVLVGDYSKLDKVNAKIIHIGTVHDIDYLVQIYSMADVFVNPTIQETFGKTTAEALACGIPIVAYNGTATPELVGEDGKCGILVNSLNTDDYKTAIENVLSSGLDYMYNCRHRAELLFDKDKNIEKYMDIINTMVN